jgi:hypothetical protein
MRVRLSHTSTGLALGLMVLSASPAAALDVSLKRASTAATVVVAAIDVRDPLPDRFRRLVDDGGVLHLRVQAELWETRPVWDHLVFPAIVRVFRLARGLAGSGVSIADSAGSTSFHTAVPNPLTVMIELGQSSRITAAARYYVRLTAIAGTLAERDADDVGDVVFGRESESTGLGSFGRMIFRTVVKVSDYLQSVSAEATSKRMSGTDLLKP